MISIPLNHYPSINSIKGKQRNEVIIMMPKVKHRFLSCSNLKQFTHEMLTSLFYLNDFLCFESSGRSCQCASDQISNPCPDSDSIPFHLVKHNCEATLWGAKKQRQVLGACQALWRCFYAAWMLLEVLLYSCVLWKDFKLFIYCHFQYSIYDHVAKL